MTKPLDKPISRVRDPIVALDDETRHAIREGLEQARSGQFVPEAEIDALWKRHGLSGLNLRAHPPCRRLVEQLRKLGSTELPTSAE
jgi:hypothetical protein